MIADIAVFPPGKAPWQRAYFADTRVDDLKTFGSSNNTKGTKPEPLMWANDVAYSSTAIWPKLPLGVSCTGTHQPAH
jgi:hypothetical protein